MKRQKLRGIYAITADDLPFATVLARTQTLVAAGVSVVQYRDKKATTGEKTARALALQKICGQHGALLIINDDVALAKKINADGVHIGSEDGSLLKARAILGGDKIIGSSCYASLARAQLSQQEGADYLAFGAMFPSPSKPSAVVLKDHHIITTAADLALPICLIGGINADNCQQLCHLPVQMWALIGALYHQADYSRIAPFLSPREIL